MVNVRNIKSDKFVTLGFKTKKEALEFIKQEKIKSNKKQNENDYLNIVEMKRQERIKNKIDKIVDNITFNVNKNEDITINEDMSAKTSQEIIKKVNKSNKKLLFTITYDNNQIRSYINDKHQFYEDNETPYGSDTQHEIKGHNVKSINVKEFHRSGNNKSIGAFFKYYNTIELDLSKYGIYHNIQESDYSNNCLINSLIQSNKFTSDQIDAIKMYCKRRDTSLKTLHSISEEFNINFIINRYRNDSEKIEKKTINVTSKTENTLTIELSLFNNHWFLYEDVNTSKFFINHYNEIKLNVDNILNYTMVNRYCKRTKKYVTRKDAKDALNSLSLVNLMYKNNLFKRINMEDVVNIPYYDSFKNDDIILPKEINESNCRIKIKEKKIKEYDYITFADFEATTMKSANIDADYHKAFMISFLTINNNHEIIDKDTLTNNISINFLERLKNNSIIYFHNLKYDKNFIFDNLTIVKYLEKEGQLYEITAKYNGKILYFRDSYKLISNPLSDFAKMFNLSVKKEIFPYDFYNEKNIEEILDNKMMLISSAVKTLSEEDIEPFKECIKNVTYNKSRFNALEYAKFYCEQDVEVLYQGMMTFRKLVLEALNIDIFYYLTISSLSEQYLINQGCYDDVYELSGIIQVFINKSVYGGRVMVSRNEPKEVEGIIQDFDACGLYASAMYTMKGFAIGKPSIINVSYFDINEENLYYIEIELLDEYYNRDKGNKLIIPEHDTIQLEHNRYEFDYDFPLWGEKESDVIDYINFPKTRKFIVNNDILSDLIKFYKLEKDIHFKINQGVIFKDGYNKKINEVMYFLYNERKIQKKQGNKIEQIYKLIMNSSYGKTLTKYNDTSITIFNSIESTKINSFIYNNYNNINEILYTKNHTIIKLYNEYGKHWNCCHIGSAVLGRSKAIMNNIFYICHHKGLTPFYQDTDSIHIPEDQLSLLPKDFIGNDMCQFHCDFDDKKFKNIDKSIQLNGPPVYSSGCIFLGKKSYIDKLRHRQSEEKYFHIRFKGINEEVINKTAFINAMNQFDLYRYMLHEGEIDFNDKLSSKPRFKQIDICNISNREPQIKKIKINFSKTAKLL